MTKLTPAERVALLMATQLRDGDTVFVGANQRFVQTAVALASAEGMGLRLVAAGGWWLDDPHRADEMLTYEPAAVVGYDVPMHQDQAFQDLGRIPFVFAGGIQIDRFGNANLIGVGHDGARWKVRGPGSAGLPTLTGASPVYYAYTLEHNHRGVVAEVEHVSALGRPSRRAELGLPPIERGAVFTPLGLFGWRGDELELAVLAPGVTEADVVAATPFSLQVSQTLSALPTPSSSQLKLLRAVSQQRAHNDEGQHR